MSQLIHNGTKIVFQFTDPCSRYYDRRQIRYIISWEALLVDQRRGQADRIGREHIVVLSQF